MFTTAEQRAVDQLSSESGRLAVVAADQRTKLVEALQAAGLDSGMDFMRAFKNQPPPPRMAFASTFHRRAGAPTTPP